MMLHFPKKDPRFPKIMVDSLSRVRYTLIIGY